MAWTSPRTWVDGDAVSAAELNLNLRDNLRVSCPPTVSAAGDLTTAQSSNSMGTRVAIGSEGSLMHTDGAAVAWGRPKESTGSGINHGIAGYIDAGVSVEIETGDRALCFYSSEVSNGAAEAVSISVGVDGASSISPSDSWRAFHRSSNDDDEKTIMASKLFNNLTVGTNEFILYSKTSVGGLVVDQDLALVVVPLS